MPLPVDFLQDANGDLDFSKGLQHTPDLPTYVRQKLSENFNFWQGEWFLDTRKGIPYFKHVIGQKFDRFLLQTLFRRAAVRTHGVGSVEALALAFDNEARELSVLARVRTVQGEEVPAPVPFIVEIT
jgi:hypothetical protein